MRREDKQVRDRSEIDAIIRDATVMRVAMALDNQPYLVPLNFGYDGESIFVHTANRGRKIDYITANPSVCFEFERNVRIVGNADKACAWGAAFESVIGFGVINELLDQEDKRNALNCIMQHYSGRTWDSDFPKLKVTRVWRIKIESLTAKRSGQD